jgi:phosphate-selective porin OprO/OprP
VVARGVALVFLLVAAPALSDEMAEEKTGLSKGDISAIVDELQRRGLVVAAPDSQAEVGAVVEEMQERGLVVSAPTPAASAEPTDWKFTWSNGFKLDRNDGAFKFKFGGRINTDAAFIWEQDGLEDDFDALGLDPKHGSGVEFRRARLFFSGTVHERIFFKAQYEFANTGDGKTDLKSLYLGMNKLGPVRDVRGGHFKEPFMLQEMTSSKNITFMERGLNNVFYPGRNVGFMATGSPLEKKLQWQVGIFRNTNDQGFDFAEWGESQFDVAARLAGTPLYADEGKKVLHLGLGYIHQFRDGKTETLRYRQRPEVHLAQRWVDTQDFAANDSDILNFEFAQVWGPLSLQSEFTYTWVEGGPGIKDSELWGHYVQASWFITGEHRPYQLGKGSFGRVKPKNNFNPSTGDWGAWEVAARYSYLDLNDRDLSGGKLWDLTVGVNWYLYPNLRLMFNYIHADVDDRVSLTDDVIPVAVGVDGAGNMFQMRAMFDF